VSLGNGFLENSRFSCVVYHESKVLAQVKKEGAMKSGATVLSVLVLFVTLASTNVWAKGWYLGGEVQLTSLGDSMVDDVETGYGFAIDFGYRFSPKFALDFLWGLSFHDEDGNDIEYMRFLGGGKLIFNDPNPLQPYLSLGLESHLIFRSILDDINGSGYYAGLGGDYYLTERSSLDFGIKHSIWTGEIDIPGTSEDLTTDTLSIAYKYHFIR
jgi:hypothetical protein